MPPMRDAWRWGCAAIEDEARQPLRRELSRARRGPRRTRCSAGSPEGRDARRALAATCRPRSSSATTLLTRLRADLLRPPRRLERDRLRRPRLAARLCPLGAPTARPLGGAGSRERWRRDRRCRLPERPRAADGRAPDVFRERRLGADARCSHRRRGGRLRHRRHRRRRRHAGLPARRGGLLRRRLRRRPLLPPAGGFRLRRERAAQALLDRRPHQRRRQPDRVRQQQLAARPSAARRCTSRWSRCASGRTGSRPRSLLGYGARLAGRLARDVALLRRGRGRAEDRPARCAIPGGRRAAATPIGRTRSTRPAHGARARREALGVAWAPTPARHPFGAARAGAPVRLSRLLQDRLLDQRQAERAGHVDARARWRPAPRSATSPMVGRIEIGPGRPRHRRALPPRGRWRRQRARNVVVAGYAIETPRLLLNSADAQFPRRAGQLQRPRRQAPDGARNHAVWATMDEEIRWYKAPPSLAVCEHWNYDDAARTSPAAMRS